MSPTDVMVNCLYLAGSLCFFVGTLLRMVYP